MNGEPVTTWEVQATKGEVPGGTNGQVARETGIDTDTPRGTTTILGLFVLLIVGLWGYMYINLLLRG